MNLYASMSTHEEDLMNLLMAARTPARHLARSEQIDRLLAQYTAWLPSVLDEVPAETLEAVLDTIACTAPKDNPQLMRCAATLRDWLLAEMDFHRTQISPVLN